MKKRLIFTACLILAPCLAIAANDPTASSKSAMQDGTSTMQDGESTVHGTDADNTGINKRDRDDQTLTPMDQKNNEADLKITQEIRQALMDDEFSMDAKNIKVITRDGTVTLRGPVDTAAELEKISVLVKAVPGIKSLDNQLQVN